METEAQAQEQVGPGAGAALSSFSVCWREYRGTVCSGLGALLREQELVDVTLAAGGALLQAHRAVLSVCSPYFRRMFQASPCHHPIVVLQDVSYQSMKDLLQFMYNGEVSIKQEDLTSFISTAETLEIKGLSNTKKIEETEEEMNVPSSTFSSNHVTSVYEEESDDSYNNAVSGSYNNISSPTRVPIRPILKTNKHKRKPESNWNKNGNVEDSENLPEKKTKYREKQILNKHKLNSIRNPISVKPLEALKAPDAIPIQDEDIPREAMNLSETNSIVDNNFDLNNKPNCLPDIKTESFDMDYPSERIMMNGNKNDKHNDLSLTTSPKTDEVSDIAAFYSEVQRFSWPIAASLLPVKSNERHTIVTIPQKEDGKKKYPQRSCRFCWRAGKRRDTRFMCAQCCVPLCKTVCFEQHQSQANFNLDSNGVV